MNQQDERTDEKLLEQELRPKLSQAGISYSHVHQLVRTKAVADETFKSLLLDASSSPVAIVFCSPSGSPQKVRQDVERAAHIADLLGDRLGSVVLHPVVCGVFNGTTYAVFLWHKALSGSLWQWRFQRVYLTPKVLRWLEEVMAATAKPVPTALIDERVKAPLGRVGKAERFSSPVRSAARLGLERLERGEWKPRQGMVHYDLWKGNILLHRANALQQKPRYGFHLIDWGAADAESFFFWDLAKFADSFNMPLVWLRHVLGRQCSLLGWNACDAAPSLLLAAERLGRNLGYYPEESYVNAVERYHALLHRAVA